MFIYNSKKKQLYEIVVLMFCIPNKKQFDYSTLINQEVTKEQIFFNSINPSIYICVSYTEFPDQQFLFVCLTFCQIFVQNLSNQSNMRLVLFYEFN